MVISVLDENGFSEMLVIGWSDVVISVLDKNGFSEMLVFRI